MDTQAVAPTPARPSPSTDTTEWEPSHTSIRSI